MESDRADGEVFLFTSESVGEGHPGNSSVFHVERDRCLLKFTQKES